MITKKKQCKICKQPKPLYSNKMCLGCFKRLNPEKFKIKSGKKSNIIKKVSNDRWKRLREYQKLRDSYLKVRNKCEKCGKETDCDLHHRGGRLGDNLFKNFCSLCRECHVEIHQNVLQAYKDGWLISRIKKSIENEKIAQESIGSNDS